jgi:hypothetical protein
MAGEALHVFQRDVLLEQVGDNGDAEAVGRKHLRQAGVVETVLQHLPHGMRGVAGVGELPAAARKSGALPSWPASATSIGNHIFRATSIPRRMPLN